MLNRVADSVAGANGAGGGADGGIVVAAAAGSATRSAGGAVAAGMVVISSAVATASGKVTYSLVSLALAASSDPIGAITFEEVAAAMMSGGGAASMLEEGGRAGSCAGGRGSGARGGRQLNRAFASLGIGRASRRASFIATPFARRRHYAIRRKRRSTAGRR